MGFSSGTFTRTDGVRTGADVFAQQLAADLDITASLLDTHAQDIANGLSKCLLKDGTQTVTANIPMATYKFTGVGLATARTDFARADQVQDSLLTYAISTGSSSAYVLTLSPSIGGAYVDGQVFTFKANHTCTGASTINVNGVGAVDIKRLGGGTLLAGDITSGQVTVVQYVSADDDFYLLSPFSLLAGRDHLPIATETYSNGTAGNVWAEVVGQTLVIDDATQNPDSWTLQAQSSSTLELSVSSAGTRNFDIVNAGAGVAALKVNGTTVSVPFTATHRYQIGPDPLVEGEAVKLNEAGEIVRCSKSCDAACAGLYTTEVVKSPKKGHIDSFENRVFNDLHHVACLGDSRSEFLSGARVCDEGGPVEAGDLLTTATRPGFLKKQVGDTYHSYTVGQYRLPREVEFDENGEAFNVYIYLLRG